MKCELCGNDSHGTKGLCVQCGILDCHVRVRPKLAIKILQQMGKLPIPGVINNTVELDGYEYDDTLLSSLELPEGTVGFIMPSKPLSVTSYQLLCRWHRLVGDTLVIRKLATNEVCGSDEEATSEVSGQDET